MSKFLRFIVNLVLVCAIVVAGGLLIPPFLGVTTYVVDDLDMNTNLPLGSVTYALDKDGAEPEVGEKILMYEEESQYLYRVVSAENGTYTLEDTLSADGGTREIQKTSLAKKAVLTVPFAGYVSMAMQSKEGLIIIALAVVFIIILFILSEIWKKDDEDDLEADDEDDEEYLSKRQLKKRRKQAAKQEKKEEKKAAKTAAKQEKKNKKKHKNTAAEPEIAENTPEEPVVMASEESVLADDQPGQTDEAADDHADLFAETRNLFAAEVADMMGMPKPEASDLAEAEDIQEPAAEITPEPIEEIEEAELEKRLAMPVYTRKELLEKARAAGEEPRIVDDEISGITLVDYSDIL